LQLLNEHRQLCRSILPKYQGREVKTTGDGFLVTFLSALAAVECAAEIQETLARRNLNEPPARQIWIRIGLHLGDVEWRDEDVLGDAVNLATRIQAQAEPGGVCLSQTLFEFVKNKTRYPLTRLGEAKLKNIDLPVCVYQVETGIARTGGATSHSPDFSAPGSGRNHSHERGASENADKRKRILIVDDEVQSMRLLKLNLERTGEFVVQMESNPLEAFRQAEIFKPDLMLLDVMMPHLDGGTLAAQFQESPKFRDVPIVFMTAVVRKEEVFNHGGRIGGLPFLAKPVNLAELVKCLKKCLGIV
jgi:CheY-like chemotaxis protein